MKTLTLIGKKVCLVLLVALMVLLVGCNDVQVEIKLELSATSITKGEEVDIATTVTGSKDQTVHLSVSNPELIYLNDENVLTVLKDITEETSVTIMAVANADKTKSDSKKLIVKPVGSQVSIVMTADKTIISKNESATMVVAVAGGNDKTYSVQVSHPELVEVKGSVVSVISNPTVDTEVTVTVTANADTTASAIKVFTVKGFKPSPILLVAKNSITEGEEVRLNVEVDGNIDLNYRYEVSDPELLEVNGNVITVKGTVTKEKFVTITAILKTDETVRVSREIFVTPPKSNVGISITSTKNTITKGEQVTLTVAVTGTEDESYTVEISNPALISVTDDVVTVIADIKVDQLVTITVISDADPTIKATKTLTVKAPIKEGEVGELTSQKLAELGNASITVDGVLTDYYVDFNASSNNVTSNYDMRVEMNQDAWVGSWNARGQEQNKITDHYRRSEDEGIKDYYGNIGHALEQLYINKNNEVAVKRVTDSSSVPVLWETRHFWNHLGNLQIDKFTYDVENEVYQYNPDFNDEEELYLMTYLSFSLTPLLADTLNELYLVIEDGEITKLIAQTSVLYYGSANNEIADADAMSYTTIELVFSEVGTTTIVDPTPFEAPTHADKLQTAMDKMKVAKNYTFKLTDIQTEAPVIDPGEYEINSTNTVNNSVMATSMFNILSSPTKIRDYQSSVGTVGSFGKITEDAALFAETQKYAFTYDGDDYSTKHRGLKQNEDGTYDEYNYDSTADTLVGTKKVQGTIFDALPKFDFSVNLFKFIGTTILPNGKTGYTFNLRETAITKDISKEISAYKYASNAESSGTRVLSIVVDEDGNLVSTVYPYSIMDIYIGHCTTIFSDFGTTELDESIFDGYIPREYKTEWSDYLTLYYTPDFSSNSYKENTEIVLEAIFGEEALSMPTPALFLDIFGDNISGPFYNWRSKGVDADDNPIYFGYMSINATSSEVDENSKITNYDEIIAELTAALEADGFTLSIANTDISGGASGRANKIACFIKGDIQIVIENNYTRHFFIYFYKTGDWTLNR